MDEQYTVQNSTDTAANNEYLTYEEILEEYRRRKMIEHLTGPVISLVLHVIVIGLLAYFLAGRDFIADSAEIEFDIHELDVPPLDREILEQIDELEPEPLTTPVPTVERPEITPDQLEDIDSFADDMALSDLDMDFAANLDVRPRHSPLVIPGMMASRTQEGRERALRQHAGPYARDTEIAVIKALEWLKDNQSPDGSWRGQGAASARTGMTGLGLLTFLAHGETPGTSERYGETVRKAIDFLLSIQREDGTFGHTEGGERGGVYSHGIASYALAEAYALTRIPDLREPVRKAISRIVRGQRPDGGFDYQFARDGGARDRCTSVAGWMAQAMKAAHLSGVDVEELVEAMDLAAQGFKLNHRSDVGVFIYASKSGARFDQTQTPVGILCLQLLGHGNSREVRNGLNFLRDARPNWQNPSSGSMEPLYAWYYATQAMFHAGTGYFRPWNHAMAPALINSQNEDGSWTVPEVHGRSAAYGPVYATTLSALSLTVYYRYLPTYQTPEERDTGFDVFALDDDELGL